jgi:hypothetical protein
VRQVGDQPKLYYDARSAIHQDLTVSLRGAECESILWRCQAVSQTVAKETAFLVGNPTSAEQQACRQDRLVFFFLQQAEPDFQ